MKPRDPAFRRRSLMAFSVLSSVTGLVVSGLLMGSHMPFRAEAATTQQQARKTGAWRALYVLGEDCPCSDRVAAHLCSRPRLSGIKEEILFVGDQPDTERNLRAAGWQLEHPDAETVRDLYGARSAPLFVVVDPEGRIRYLGGLARRSDFRDGFQENRIWKQLRDGENVAPLPAYGCALTFGCGSGGLKEAAARFSR